MTQPSDADSHMYDRDDNPMINDQQAAVANITVTGTYTTDDTPIETAINGILAAMRQHGLIAD